jgi:Ca-activated chloride channel family protein
MRVAATLCCLLVSSLAGASAVLRPPDATGAPRMVLEQGSDVDWLPLKDHRVDVEVAGIIAQVRVTQVYQNTGKVPLNAHYMFPAGTRSAVSAMSITVGDHTTRAVLRERGEAQQVYKRAQQEGKTAGLLEQQRPNVLTMQVANVLPGDVVTVELEYTELLLPEDGTYELVLPAVVGPRYASQREDDVPALPSPANTLGAAHRYDATVRIASGIPLAHVTSGSHRIGTLSNPDGSVQVVLDGGEENPGNRDFILRYRLADDEIQAGVMVHQAATGTLLAMVEPPQRVAPEDIVPREYIFLVDVSGSMGGKPLQTAQLLVRKLAAALRPSDRFNVVLFESAPLVLFKRSLPATADHVRAACDVLDTGRGGGGTEMIAGLQAALELPRTPGMSRTVLLVTDGYVNVEQKAFQLVRSHLNGMNLFAFGIGSSVNRHLIEGMARAGRGEPFIVEEDDRAEAAASRFWNYVRRR